jgi:glycosyltransferase involved in cell wall biosynthesis
MPTGRALFVVPEVPYPTHGGGALRSASVLEYLSSRYQQVDVIVFREPGSEDPAQALPAGRARRIHVIDLPHHRKDSLSRISRNTGRLLRRVPPLVDRFNGFGESIAAFVAGSHYDVAVVEHFWCAPYWDQLAPVCTRTVLDLHNIESALHARCARAGSGPQALAHMIFEDTARELESRWLPLYDCLLTSSDADARRARAISPRSNVIVYPNSIPACDQPRATERETVAFSGNLEYHPNISAVRFFYQEIWPRLRDRYPGLVWRLIGRNPDAVRKYIDRDSRIELTGTVDNAVAELAAAQVVVVPLLAGSGTRFKVIEAWAAGRAVVSTRIGAEGLPVLHGDNILIADDARSFADAVVALLDSPELRQRLGRAGRQLFETEFTWESTRKKLNL